MLKNTPFTPTQKTQTPELAPNSSGSAASSTSGTPFTSPRRKSVRPTGVASPGSPDGNTPLYTSPRRTMAEKPPLPPSPYSSPLRVMGDTSGNMLELTTEGQFLRIFIDASFSDSHELNGDRWQIATTVPSEVCDQSIMKLQNLINVFFMHNNKRISSGTIEKYKTIQAEIESVLWGDTGVYYTMTSRGDIDKLHLNTRHIAHARLYEKVNKTEVGGKGHAKKALDIANRLERLIKRLDDCKGNIDRLRKEANIEVEKNDELDNLMSRFKHYFALHADLIRRVESYIVPSRSNRVVVFDSITNDFVKILHPQDMKKVTPYKATPVSRNFHAAKRQKLSDAEIVNAHITGASISSKNPRCKEQNRKKNFGRRMDMSDVEMQESSQIANQDHLAQANAPMLFSANLAAQPSTQRSDSPVEDLVSSYMKMQAKDTEGNKIQADEATATAPRSPRPASRKRLGSDFN